MALYAAMAWLEFRYWKQLSISTLIGIPELSRPEERKGRLLRDGIYGVVRHPRYLAAGLGVVGNALIVNYAGLDVLVLVAFALGYPLLWLEERELVGRFGEDYREYQRRVPQLIPRGRFSSGGDDDY